MKTNITKTVLLLCISLIGISCISRKNYTNRVNSWQGANVNNLITSWGPPANVYTMPNGNKMYTWLYTSDGYVTTRYNEFLDQIVERKNVPYCKTTFTANQHDIIVNWRVQGDVCVSFK